MTQTLSDLGSRLAARLALAFAVALLLAAAPSLIDAWHDGGPLAVAMRLGYVMDAVIWDLVNSLAA